MMNPVSIISRQLALETSRYIIPDAMVSRLKIPPVSPPA